MEPEIRQYSVADLRGWLEHNQAAAGLSEFVIDPQRAWAIVHNPYVEASDVVVSAVFEGDELEAFAACFPDRLGEERIWWYSTLFCRPESRGKGYGVVVLGLLSEAHEEERFFDMDGASETVESLNFLGLEAHYVPRYHFCEKRIDTCSMRGKLAAAAEKMRQRKFVAKRNDLRQAVKVAGYGVKYVTHIDDATYAFIENHACENAFLRSRQMLNWILAYPFNVMSPLCHRVKGQNTFGSAEGCYSMNAVQVWKEGSMVGFYIYRVLNKELSVKYLYCDSEAQREVFLSIAEHYMHAGCTSIKTVCVALADWLRGYHLTGKELVERQSFSCPRDFDYDGSRSVQGGDGDTFV